MKTIMNRLLIVLLVFLGIFVLVACEPSEDDTEMPEDNDKLYRTDVLEDIPEILAYEHERAFTFFYERANDDLDSDGYGLIPDRYNTFTGNPGGIASIASVGFGLSALPLGIESDYITREAGEERAYHTLLTLRDMQRTHGFWYHFVDMETGLRAWNSEVSVIDTAILMNGALVVGRYFGGRTEQLAYELYEEVEWDWYFDPVMNKFYMGYRPETGFEGYWDMYGEQLMIYILSAGSPTYPVGKGAYDLMKFSSVLAEPTETYDTFYLTWTGSLFTYQYSHAWFDFASYDDQTGTNWFRNSQNAVDAAIAFAKTQDEHPGIHENSWGMSATDGPDGYVGPYGSAPSAGNAHVVDGTVPAYGAFGSLPFRPEESIAAIENYATYERFLNEDYGFKGAYNLTHSTNGWFASDMIGIDKGISLLMIENYLSGMIWDIYMEVPYVSEAIRVLKFEPSEG
jgi:hypothetical protein